MALTDLQKKKLEASLQIAVSTRRTVEEGGNEISYRTGKRLIERCDEQISILQSLVDEARAQ